MRDMTKQQFDAACERHGFKAESFMGYYRLNTTQHIAVSIWNAGANRRAQLAYLLRKQEEEESKIAALGSSDKPAHQGTR
jgi:hypothetical protein